MKNFVSSAVLMGLFFSASGAHSQVDPNIDWKQARLGSFQLVYDAQHQEIAEIYAARLLKLERELHSQWPVLPKKTLVVLNDRTDLTNGYATFLPYPLMMLYPVLPTTQDSIGEFDDWAWELLVHEYTHILSFEQRRGIPWGLSWIFGSILTPNALLPRWLLEGAAVENETHFSRAGRLRSALQAGTLRSLEIEGVLTKFRYNEINETAIPTFPYGNRPYLFGSLLWSHMAFKKGNKSIGDLHYKTGGRVPYLIETPMREYFDGLNQAELYNEALLDLQKQIQKQLLDLKKIALTETLPIDPEMMESQSPALSPDGLKLAYISRNETLKRRIQILVRPQVEEMFAPQHRRKQFGKDEDLSSTDHGSPIPRLQGELHSESQDSPPGGNITRLDWHPDSQQLAYDQVSEKNRFHEYSNIWIYNLKSGKSERITKDGRAREPAFSPDGRRIAYVLLDAGRTHLAVFHRESKESKTLLAGRGQSRASHPLWLSESEILFSERENGEEKALIYNLQTQQTRRVLNDFKNPQSFSIHRSPSSPSPRILFTSTKNGVRNAYETDLQFSSAQPVSHSGTFVHNALIDAGAKKYIGTFVSSKGNQIVAFDQSEKNRLPPALPEIKGLWEERYPETRNEPLASVSLGEISENYSPWSYLWPRYWLPFVSFGPDGFLGSVSTSGQDPLGKHSYFINGLYDSAIRQGSILATYTNQSFFPLFTLTYYDIYTRLADPSLLSRSQVSQFSIAQEVESLSPDFFVSLGYTALHREKLGFASDQAGPFLGFSFKNISRSGYQISPEAGIQTQLVLSSKEDRNLKRRNSSAEGALTHYFSRWFPKRHALMTKISGRYTDEILRVEALDSSVADLTTSATPIGNYLMRGYPTGTFLGKTLAALNLEYRFPLTRIDRGPELYPFYVHQVHGALVVDGILLDGYVYNTKLDPKIFQRQEWGTGFVNAGIEARFEMNLGYHLPVTLATGLYWPLNSKISASQPLWGLGLQL